MGKERAARAHSYLQVYLRGNSVLKYLICYFIKNSRYKLKTFKPHTFHHVGSFQLDLYTAKLNFVPVRLMSKVLNPRCMLWQFCFQKLRSKQNT